MSSFADMAIGRRAVDERRCEPHSCRARFWHSFGRDLFAGLCVTSCTLQRARPPSREGRGQPLKGAGRHAAWHRLPFLVSLRAQQAQAASACRSVCACSRSPFCRRKRTL